MTKRTTSILGGCLCSLALIACGSDSSDTSNANASNQGASAPQAANATPGVSSSAQAGSGAAAAGDKSASPSGEPAKSDDAAQAAAPGAAANPAAGAAQTPANNTTPGAQTPTEPAKTPGATAAIDWTGDIRGKCTNFKTKFPGDEACIPAPPPGEGMQIHVGPSNWDDPEEVAKYVMKPGEESSDCFTVLTPNDKEIVYQTSTLSGRAGTHHIINTMYAGDGKYEPGSARCEGSADMASSLGSLPGASKPYMPRLSVAPEYANVGRKIPAHARMSSDLHYYNFTDHDIVREYWLNIYFAKPEEITQDANQIAALGGLGWNRNPIMPGTDKVYSYQCPIKGNGYIMQLLGHYHAHGRQFTASIQRKATGMKEKVFEMFDYQEPAQFEYNSIITNPMFAEGQAGAVTGRLPVSDGDVLHWDCHIVNDSDVALKYVNEVKTGEMCNLWGATVGTMPISCYVQ